MSHRWPILVSFLLGIAIAILRFGPAIFNPEHVLLGGWDHPDSLSNHWLLVWVSEQLSNGGSLLHNERYYVPVGDSPWLAGNGSVGFWMAPLIWALGWPTAVPIGFLCLWGGIALALYALCQSYGLQRWNSIFPITLVLCSSYLGQELSASRFSQVDILWFCLSWAAYIRLLKEPSTKLSVLTGMLVAMTAFMYWYYGWFFAMIAAIEIIPKLLKKEAVPFKSIALAALTSLLCLTPLIGLFVRHWANIPGTDELQFPSAEAIQNGLTSFPIAVTGPDVGIVSVLAMTGLGLAIAVGIRERHWRPLMGILLTAFIFALLSMGTHTPLYEWVYGIASPLKRFWWPSRHILVYGIAISIMAGWGVQHYLRRFSLSQGILAQVILVLLVPLSLMWQGQSLAVVTTPLADPLPYTQLDELPEGGVIQLPLSPKVTSSQAPLYFQLHHRREMLNGHAQWVDRVRPSEWDAQVEARVFLRGLQSYEAGEEQAQLSFDERSLAELKGWGIRYIILDPALYPKDLSPMLRGLREGLTVLFGRPVLRHEAVLIWDVQSWTKIRTVSLAKWEWPKRLLKGDGSQPIRGPMPPNPYLMGQKHK